jgi:hypothetical protein
MFRSDRKPCRALPRREPVLSGREPVPVKELVESSLLSRVSGQEPVGWGRNPWVGLAENPFLVPRP